MKIRIIEAESTKELEKAVNTWLSGAKHGEVLAMQYEFRDEEPEDEEAPVEMVHLMVIRYEEE
jgi:hypothetical protein